MKTNLKEPTRSWRHFGPGLVLVLVTWALFSPVLTAEFLGYDDQQYVTENPHVLGGLSWAGVAWAFGSFYASNWHPLTWLSHMLDCQLFGLHPAGHHLTNLLLHGVNTLLLFDLFRRLTGARWRSAAVAALFAWHPLHVESVAWVAERKDLLSALFFLLSLGAYARYVQAQGGGWTRVGLPYGLSVTWFALGLMSKPMVVTLPGVLLLLDGWPLRREVASPPPAEALPAAMAGRLPLWALRLVEKLPFLALSAGACLLTVLAQHQGGALVSATSLPFSRRLAHALVAYGHYLWAMVVPRHLAVYYPYTGAEAAPAVWAAAGLVGGLSMLVLWQRRPRPYLLVGWLWFLGMLVPVIGLVQVGDQAWADRYTYLPLVGMFVALVWTVGDWAGIETGRPTPVEPGARQRRRVRLVQVLVPILAVGLWVGTLAQLRYWQNTRALFTHAAEVTVHNGRALTVLGSLLAQEHKLPEAMALYDQALSFRPWDPEAHFFRGNALEEQGQLTAAAAEYRQALGFKPLAERTHLALGVALGKAKDFDGAAAEYREVLALNPDSALAQNNLAKVLHTQGRLEEAIPHYRAALRLDPKLAQAHNNLGVVLLQQNRVAEGAAELRAALRLRPEDPEFQYNLALACNQQAQWQEAAQLLGRLAPSRPHDARLHYEWGLAQAHLGRTREAMSHYAHALLEQPEYPEALDRLAWILATEPAAEVRNGPEAVRMAEGACALTGRQRPVLLLTLAAAYAEVGRFEEATTVARQAQELAEAAGQTESAARSRAMLQAAQAGRPWREPVPGRQPN